MHSHSQSLENSSVFALSTRNNSGTENYCVGIAKAGQVPFYEAFAAGIQKPGRRICTSRLNKSRLALLRGFERRLYSQSSKRPVGKAIPDSWPLSLRGLHIYVGKKKKREDDLLDDTDYAYRNGLTPGRSSQTLHHFRLLFEMYPNFLNSISFVHKAKN